MSIKKYVSTKSCPSRKKLETHWHDTFAVAVIKDVVGHLPQHISRNVNYFLSHSGNNATCTVTGQ